MTHPLIFRLFLIGLTLAAVSAGALGLLSRYGVSRRLPVDRLIPWSFGILVVGICWSFVSAALLSVAPAKAAPRSANALAARPLKPSPLPAPPPAPAAPPEPYSDLAGTLTGWATAMQSNNPAREASFYAGRMDRYFLRAGVSNGFVYNDKVSFIRRGNRLRLFELENVALEAASPNAADLRLVKHYVLASPSATTERSVHSRLRLRKEDGAWKIAAEQDLK